MKKFFLFLMSILLISCNGQENKVSKKKNLKMENKNLEYATFGGGCFWCVEACFDMLKGVESVTSGYSGGHKENPTYEEVCTGETGHAEVVQIAFDPSVISFSQLLESFWFLHDPTQLNRQGEDIGTQYRSNWSARTKRSLGRISGGTPGLRPDFGRATGFIYQRLPASG